MKVSTEYLGHVEAILEHMATAPLDEEWPDTDPAEHLKEAAQEALDLLHGKHPIYGWEVRQ